MVCAGLETKVEPTATCRRSQRFEPARRIRDLRRQRDVDEVAGDRDVVRLYGVQIRDDRGEDVAAMDGVALADPVEVAEQPLRRELADARRRQWREMGIG